MKFGVLSFELFVLKLWTKYGCLNKWKNLNLEDRVASMRIFSNDINRNVINLAFNYSAQVDGAP